MKMKFKYVKAKVAPPLPKSTVLACIPHLIRGEDKIDRPLKAWEWLDKMVLLLSLAEGLKSHEL